MKLLLDESLPRRLKRDFSGHEVSTVQELGWSGIKNGDLVRRAKARAFDVLITADQNLQYQQNLAGSPVSIVVLAARSNRYEDLRPLALRASMLFSELAPGKIVRLTQPVRRT